MASLPRRTALRDVCFWCFVITLTLLHTLPRVTSNNDVIRFDQKKTDSDSIYDILEDEQFVLADTKLVRQKPQLSRSRTASAASSASPASSPGKYANSSSSSSSSSLPLGQDSGGGGGGGGSGGGKTAVAPTTNTTTTQPRTSSSSSSSSTTRGGDGAAAATRGVPGQQHPGYHPHMYTRPSSSSSSSSSSLDRELLLAEDDLLIYSDDREEVDMAEERMRAEEEAAVRRVRRQATTVNSEGCGENSVGVQITSNIPWIPEYLNDASPEYATLAQNVLSAIQALFASLGMTATVRIVGFQ
ncbi:uncharacterized protein LOC143276675 [Babylonia areolata]|uniref:uncharacterized protein LOC143276675 n=1 Tax=Babylonia areolata TaxID=304850 RepID=UPI003FD4F0EB